MTTTLRPAGAERAQPGGGRSRDFTVCVNGRPVGGLRLTAEAPGGSGRIEALTVDGPDRRRGRGTVAALAAEEVLRQWGCTRVTAAVPPAAAYGLRIVRALGYTEANRTLGKELPAAPGPAPLPPGLRLHEPDAACVAQWLAEQQRAYAEALAGTGLTAERAAQQAAASAATALPGSRVLTLDAAGATVGRLWLRTDPPPAWVLAVEVAPAHRGRGLGRTLMLAAEPACRSAGAREIRLDVLTGNTAGLRLYAALGYDVRTRHFWKGL
ncbi:GNAT family N-acetyltransferase [Streptomyces sp. NPDC020983]|uniref:GNAT family N-acetyltransferase n=1 Tax=Streptomyces sp. NPDC020983 TaxID=3365106 RepID=UPI00379BA8D0